jgi:hypothetical protein
MAHAVRLTRGEGREDRGEQYPGDEGDLLDGDDELAGVDQRLEAQARRGQVQPPPDLVRIVALKFCTYLIISI